jgi:hypothetical protein
MPPKPKPSDIAKAKQLLKKDFIVVPRKPAKPLVVRLDPPSEDYFGLHIVMSWGT